MNQRRIEQGSVDILNVICFACVTCNGNSNAITMIIYDTLGRVTDHTSILVSKDQRSHKYVASELRQRDTVFLNKFVILTFKTMLCQLITHKNSTY